MRWAVKARQAHHLLVIIVGFWSVVVFGPGSSSVPVVWGASSNFFAKIRGATFSVLNLSSCKVVALCLLLNPSLALSRAPAVEIQTIWPFKN
tara:strand:- start:126 stop:401 length:276 start_codon:yes stop_codon:yes gene_type:complete